MNPLHLLLFGTAGVLLVGSVHALDNDKLHRLRQKMLYIPTSLEGGILPTSRSEAWLEEDHQTLELLLFERLLQSDSLSLSMPPVTSPTTPTSPSVPTVPSSPVAPIPPSAPISPSVPTLPTSPTIPSPVAPVTPSAPSPQVIPTVIPPVPTTTAAPTNKAMMGPAPSGGMSKGTPAPLAGVPTAPTLITTPSAPVNGGVPVAPVNSKSKTPSGGQSKDGSLAPFAAPPVGSVPVSLPTSKEDTNPSAPTGGDAVPSTSPVASSPTSVLVPTPKGSSPSAPTSIVVPTPTGTSPSAPSPTSIVVPTPTGTSPLAPSPTSIVVPTPTGTSPSAPSPTSIVVPTPKGTSPSAPSPTSIVVPTPKDTSPSAPSPTSILVPTPKDTSPSAPTSVSNPTPTGTSPSVPSIAPSSFTDQGTSAPASVREEYIMTNCGVTEMQRSNAILDILSMTTEHADLVSNTTMAFQARQWLDKEDDLILCTDSSFTVTQRYIMALFYFQLNGDEWFNCRAATAKVAGSCTDGKPWLDMSHECDWYGAECDATSKAVTKLTLKANNLMGVLPNEICFLVDLVGLSLDHNLYIGGTIPEGIGKLSQLTYIELDENFLGGTIPTALYQMTQLQAVDLNGNKLTGTIPESIANLKALSVFQVEDNLLFGQLPSALSMLQDLLVLYVHGNNFTGSILESVCDMLPTRRIDYPGYLQFLTADCKDSSKVLCSCCDCF